VDKIPTANAFLVFAPETSEFRRRDNFVFFLCPPGKVDCFYDLELLGLVQMIRNVFINGSISTLFVMEEESGVEYTHPLVEALKEQAERIDLLEKQNRELLKQEKILLNLLEMSATTGDIMARSLKVLQNMEEKDNPGVLLNKKEITLQDEVLDEKKYS